MADYYPLISRAVAGLEKNNGENRRALYERARAALLAQLRGVTPALPETDITRERLALEESIRKVEAEAARQFEPSRSQAAPKPRAPEPGRWEEEPRAPRERPRLRHRAATGAAARPRRPSPAAGRKSRRRGAAQRAATTAAREFARARGGPARRRFRPCWAEARYSDTVFDQPLPDDGVRGAAGAAAPSVAPARGGAPLGAMAA